MSEFLKHIQTQIYNERKALNIGTKYVYRKEITVRGVFVEIWFLTKGCQWDASGGCVMCNYGKGHDISADEMITSISSAFEEAGSDIAELTITPSGSFLDMKEVPVQVRQFIYDKVNKSKIKRFVFETRVDTINEESIKELRKSLPDKNLAVEIGLETSNQWISEHCLNKGTKQIDFINAFNILKSNCIEIIVNISLGIPFLSEKESIESTIKSLLWAYENGADSVIIFPLHIKPDTLLNILFEKKYYKPISLWSLVSVLQYVPNNYLQQTQISWYKNYYSDPSKIIASPHTCPVCYSKVITLLDKYRATCSRTVIQELNLIGCNCKLKWSTALHETYSPLVEKVYKIYEDLSKIYYPTNWWNQNKEKIYGQLTEMPCI